MTQYTLSDMIGLIGVILTLLAYFLLHIDKLKSDDISYGLLNALGSAGVLYSLIDAPNVSAAIMEVCWFSISIYGIGKAFMARKSLEQS